MKTLTLSAIALGAATLLPFASAAQEDSLKVVNFKNLALKPKSKRIVTHAKIGKRADTLQINLANVQQSLYAINLTIGSNQQALALQIDTGSSDMWVPVTGSPLCQIRNADCGAFGTFSPGQSTSLKNLSTPFQISYGDGTQISGTFVTDNVVAGSANINSVQFATCNRGSTQTGVQGILGIGYESLESGSDTYPNFVSDLASQNFINKKAYSLWLNDPDSADGNVLFGGIDTAKFNSPLIAIPVVPDASGNYNYLNLPLTGISFSADGQSFTYTKSNYASPALIDSGTTLMYLPDDVVMAIGQSLGAQQTSDGYLVLPCSYGNDASAKMTFEFNGANGAKIDVLLSDLLEDAGITQGGQEQCLLLLTGGAPDDLLILGDAFMRSAYIVYDLDTNYIALAQSKFNVTESNIVEISGSAIPSASVMSTLVAQATVGAAASSVLPGQGQETGARTSGGANGALESGSNIPTFSISGSTARPTHNAASASFKATSGLSVVGIVASTVTLLSVFGGAMIMWF